MRPRDFLSTSFCLCVGVRVGVLAWVCLRGCACVGVRVRVGVRVDCV
jgi:hypothetical protein